MPRPGRRDLRCRDLPPACPAWPVVELSGGSASISPVPARASQAARRARRHYRRTMLPARLPSCGMPARYCVSAVLSGAALSSPVCPCPPSLPGTCPSWDPGSPAPCGQGRRYRWCRGRAGCMPAPQPAQQHPAGASCAPPPLAGTPGARLCASRRIPATGHAQFTRRRPVAGWGRAPQGRARRETLWRAGAQMFPKPTRRASGPMNSR